MPPARKKKGREKQEDKKTVSKVFREQKSLMMLMLKCIVQSQQRLRDVEGVVFTVVLLPAVAAIVGSAKQQGALYNERCKTKGHGLGAPHLYVYGAVLSCLAGQDKACPSLKELYTQYKQLDLTQRSEVVRFFKVTRTYKEETAKLIFSFGAQGQRHRDALLKIISQEPEWDLKTGRAPPSHMEEQVQSWIKAFTE